MSLLHIRLVYLLGFEHKIKPDGGYDGNSEAAKHNYFA
jgi:hypothetical protein